MRTFFTADLHLGHANIIVYANRPFLKNGDLLEKHTDGKPKWASPSIALDRAEKMNERIVKEINMRCNQPGDVLISVGDFCCYGNEKGVAGVKTKAQEWEEMINPTIVHVFGNHDKNNSVKGCINGMSCRLSHFNCWVQHFPPWDKRAIQAPFGTDAYICGHVHDNWAIEKYKGKPVINVGLDVNNLRPFRKDEVITLIRENR